MLGTGSGEVTFYRNIHRKIRVTSARRSCKRHTPLGRRKPKGVMGRHTSDTFPAVLTETFGLSENDHFSFLSSIYQQNAARIFTALSIGNLHIPSDDAIAVLESQMRLEQKRLRRPFDAHWRSCWMTRHASRPPVRQVFGGVCCNAVDRVNKLMPRPRSLISITTETSGRCYVVFPNSEWKMKGHSR
jgi:hypothetical protein